MGIKDIDSHQTIVLEQQIDNITISKIPKNGDT